MNKKIVIVDIDGTISKVGDRLRFLSQKPKDWDSFYNDCFEDEPISDMINLVNILLPKYYVVFCTGRRESVREMTVNWLKSNLDIKKVVYPLQLFMRSDGDFRHDTEVKPELLKKSSIQFSDIAFVLEDRNSMVAKWRELGLTCLQVAEGDF